MDGTISVVDLTRLTKEADTDDSLDFTLTPEQPVAKMGFFGPRSEFMYSLSTVETLSLWNLTTGDRIADFADVRTTLSRLVAGSQSAAAAANGESAYPISYLIDCMYEPVSQRLYLAAGSANGSILLVHVNRSGLQPVCRLDGGHSACVRDLLWVGQTLVSGGEDARVCSWTALGNPNDSAAASAVSNKSGASGSGGGSDSKHSFPTPSTANNINSGAAAPKGFSFDPNIAANAMQSAAIKQQQFAAAKQSGNAEMEDVGKGVRIMCCSASRVHRSPLRGINNE